MVAGTSSKRKQSAQGPKQTPFRLTAPAAPETQEQEALITWVRIQERRYRALRLLYAVPNGGWRHKAVAVALYRQGVRPGIPDLCLPVARQGFHGLYLEMKSLRLGADTSADQDKIIAALREEGYRVEVCAGWERARDVIVDYLSIMPA